MTVYEKTIKETIELLSLIISATDKSITNEDKDTARELRIEYKKRLTDIEKK